MLDGVPRLLKLLRGPEAATRQTATEIALYDGVAERWRGGYKFTGSMTELEPLTPDGVGRWIGKVSRIHLWGRVSRL